MLAYDLFLNVGPTVNLSLTPLLQTIFPSPTLDLFSSHLRRTPPSREALRHSGGERRRCTSPTVTLYLEVELSSERRPGTEQKTSAGLDTMPMPRPSLPMANIERDEPLSLDGMGTAGKRQKLGEDRWESGTETVCGWVDVEVERKTINIHKSQDENICLVWMTSAPLVWGIIYSASRPSPACWLCCSKCRWFPLLLRILK